MNDLNFRTTKSTARPLRIDHVTKRHAEGTAPAVDNLSMEVRAGEFLTLLGPSGSGKTTLLNMLAGFSTPTSGSICLGNEEITRVPVHKRDFGMVFQNYALFPHMSALDNVAFPLRRRGRSKSAAALDAKTAMQTVGLAGFEARKPSQLSGGQQQRVAVARAIVYRPKVVLMDEPFGALDKKLRQDLQLEMLRLHRDLGLTFVFVTHDQEEALSMSDRIAVLDHGRLQQVGTPEQLYNAPATEFVAEFIGESNKFSGASRSATVTDTSVGQVAHPRHALVNVNRVSVIVRPESVRLHETGTAAGRSEDVNVVASTVLESIFLGDVHKVVVRFTDGTRGLALEPARSGRHFRPGDTVDFSWRVADGHPVAQHNPISA